MTRTPRLSILGSHFALLCFASFAFAQSPTVATDRPEYQPGQSVVITGSGWLPGESVSLLLVEDPVTHGDRVLIGVADGEGNFTNAEYAPEEHDVGVSFTLVATGQSSGWTAQTTFSDGGPPNYPLPVSIPYFEDFSGLPHLGGCIANSNLPGQCTPGESWPTGWEGWRVFPTSTLAYIFTDPTVDENLRRLGTAGNNTGGVYNYDGKIGFLASGTSNPAIALSVDPTGYTSLKISFDVMTIRNPFDGVPLGAGSTRINRVDLQYYDNNSGSWQSVTDHVDNSGGPYYFAEGFYENTPGPLKRDLGDTTPQNLQHIELMLPSDQLVYTPLLLRWVQRDFTGGGSRPSFAFDNVRIEPTGECPIVDNAGPIGGPTSVCPGTTSSYSIPPTSGATTYAWSVPFGASIVSGDGTTEVVVQWGATGGTVAVLPSNDCNSGGGATFSVNTSDTTPPTLSGMPGNITAFTGPGATGCSAIASWAPPTASDDCSGASIVSNHAPGEVFPVGNTLVTYTATDGVGLTSSASFTVTVIDNTPPTIVGLPGHQTFYTGPGATSCEAIAGWLPPSASDNCPGVTLLSDRVPGASYPVGDTQVTYVAKDASGLTTSGSFVVTVIDNTPPTIHCPGNLVLTPDAGRCTAGVQFAPTLSDNCPGATTYTSSPASPFDFPVGITTVTIAATDQAGNQSQCSFTVTVENPPPIVAITAPASGSVVAVNTPMSFSGSFVDNVGDLHTARWYFDGNLASDPVTIAGDGSGSGTISTTHSFASAGVYFVKLEVFDFCGGSAIATQVDGMDAMVVVYDPSQGFVTGGGWIDSPPGAYRPDVSLVGRANFGFVSKYQRGATIPTGETEFQFRAGDLNFHSTSYEWLVIAGARAQYRGKGKINGGGDYAFMLTAIDGQRSSGGGVDKLRMKIWERSTNQLVYDNHFGAGDDAAPSTALGGGSIVIHATSGGTVTASAGGSLPSDAGTRAALEFAVRPNSPNPFRDVTQFGIDLPEECRASIVLYDVSGRLVARVFDGILQAGINDLAWDGRDARGIAVRPGVYWARVRALATAGTIDRTQTLKVVRAMP